MKKLLKWLGIIIGSLVLIAVITIFIIVNRMNGRMEKKWTVNVEKMVIPSDSVSLEIGKFWIHQCQQCHGEALQGKVFFDDPDIGKIYSANLTKGKGGIGATYTEEDWIRALRHGVKKEGRALFVMPSKDIHNMGENDLACLIAYLKTIPGVDGEKGENRIPILTKILMSFGVFGEVFSAEVINHDEGFKQAPKRASNVEFGDYLVKVFGCRTCHGPELNGGKSPDPNSPFVPNLTPAGAMSNWTDQQFIHTLKTGKTPEKPNVEMNSEFMPWRPLSQMSEDDMLAIFKYLKTLKKLDTPKS